MFTKVYEEKYMRFPSGLPKAVTFSYDDGVAADKRLLEIFKKYGMKATFNLNNELFDAQCWNGRMNEEQTLSLFRGKDCEVAMHGARHVFLDKVPLPEAVNEIVKNRGYLEKNFGRTVRGMAYAYGAYNDEIVDVLSKLGVTYARTTQSSHTFDIPTDWLRLRPTCHHNDPQLNELAQRFITSSPLDIPKHREPWLFYIWGHSFEFDNDNNWNVIEKLCSRLSKCKDVWFATNQEVYDYVKAYENLIFSLDGERCLNQAYMGVWLEIRGKIYHIPAGGEVVFDK